MKITDSDFRWQMALDKINKNDQLKFLRLEFPNDKVLVSFLDTPYAKDPKEPNGELRIYINVAVWEDSDLKTCNVRIYDMGISEFKILVKTRQECNLDNWVFSLRLDEDLSISILPKWELSQIEKNLLNYKKLYDLEKETAEI
jgi:hypothetical protein